ncbi:MAG: cell division ATP-binding protein FtsE [Lachnospiraceae bacterium]|nr:cell division ATP-binding protein FtsE [Lachnospiraceae bacterium]
MIQFRQISKQYNDGAKTLALDGVDLSIRDGEFVFITGDSGAGKSTLVRLLMGMEKPTSGTILVDGINVAQLERSKLPKFRRRFGCIYQDFQLLSDFTAYDNVAFAQRVIGTKAKNIKKRVPKALAEVGLEEKAKSYPSQLSGGEQQRVAIARALVNGPLYLIADEPTGNLDRTNTDEVMALLEAFNNSGNTVIVITHDEQVVERMHKRVIEMKSGRIIADTAWLAAEKEAESVQPVPDNIELAAPAPAVELPKAEEAPAPKPAEPEPEPVLEAQPEEDDGYVQQTLDLSPEPEEEEAEQVVMDLEAITPPQPEPEILPDLPPLVVPTVELPESESARKSKVVSEVLKGWKAPTEALEIPKEETAAEEPVGEEPIDSAEPAEEEPAEETPAEEKPAEKENAGEEPSDNAEPAAEEVAAEEPTAEEAVKEMPAAEEPSEGKSETPAAEAVKQFPEAVKVGGADHA